MRYIFALAIATVIAVACIHNTHFGSLDNLVKHRQAIIEEVLNQ